MSRDGSGRPTSWAHRRAHCDGVALRTDHASQGAMLQLATCEGELCGQPHSYLSNIDSAVPGRRAEQAANSPGVSGAGVSRVPGGQPPASPIGLLRARRRAFSCAQPRPLMSLRTHGRNQRWTRSELTPTRGPRWLVLPRWVARAIARSSNSTISRSNTSHSRNI
jgi:hypothetical protein